MIIRMENLDLKGRIKIFDLKTLYFLHVINISFDIKDKKCLNLLECHLPIDILCLHCIHRSKWINQPLLRCLYLSRYIIFRLQKKDLTGVSTEDLLPIWCTHHTLPNICICRHPLFHTIPAILQCLQIIIMVKIIEIEKWMVLILQCPRCPLCTIILCLQITQWPGSIWKNSNTNQFLKPFQKKLKYNKSHTKNRKKLLKFWL